MIIQQQLDQGNKRFELMQLRKQELTLLLQQLEHSKSEKRQSAEPQQQAVLKSTSGISHSNASNKKIKLGGFADHKGNMSLPTQAEILNRFGDKKLDSGLNWEGLMFGVQAGQPVAAIYPGQVVFSDWFRGYGQLLVIDHGNGYMSLYGHNQQLSVQSGNMVDAGELIAYAGSTGGLSKPGLYFEIRYNGVPDNPLNWCQL